MADLTITNLPLMSRMVRLSGAAMVERQSRIYRSESHVLPVQTIFIPEKTR